jgi:PAS domain S-box-containing protein
MWLCLTGATVGALGLLFDALGVREWTAVVPGDLPMPRHAALGLLLLGAGGALRWRVDAGRARKTLSSLASFIVLMIGLGWLAGLHGGQPAPLTALALTLLAASLLLFDVRPSAPVRPSELLAIGGGLAALVVLLEFVLGLAMVPRSMGGPIVGVPVAAAAGLLVTSMGLLQARPAAGLIGLMTSSGPLQATLADLNRAQAVANVGSWRLDVPRNELRWSAQNYRMFGVAPGTAMTHERFLACVHPEDRDQVHRKWTAALHGESFDIEYRVVAAGAVKWVREKADLELDERGQLVGGIGVTHDITEIKQFQEEQRRARVEILDSQRRLELALTGAGLATWDWNVTTGEVIFNDRWAELRGLRLEDVKPRVESWSSGIHPDDLPGLQQALSEHFAGHTDQYRAEYRVRTRSGELLWISDLGKVFARDASGAPVRMVGVEADVTERKHLEMELRLAEAKSSGIVSLSVDAIISCDGDQRITLFNEGAERIFGYSTPEVIGTQLDMLIPDRLRATHRQQVQRFAAGGERARRMGERGAEILGLRKNGEVFPADAAISSLDVAGAKILTVSLRDITEQKQLEREQQLLAELGSILVSTLEQRETLRAVANALVGHLAGVSLVEALEASGQPRLVAVGHRDPGMARLARRLEEVHVQAPACPNQPLLLTELSPESLESMGWNEEQREILRGLAARSLMALPLVARGQVLGSLVVISTDRCYAERDRCLLEKVASRAALALENARLYRVAQEALQTRDDVLGIVAHDLRNPLGTILIQAGVLKDTDPARPVRGARPAEVIERAARRMNRLIQDLLDVARIEGGSLSVEQACLPVRQTIVEVLAAQEALAARASVALRLDLGQDIPDIWADRERLVQVFDNLLGNAIKFTGPGGRITVGARPQPGEIVFWVTDTGSGIAPQDLPHLFERFWQARRATRSGAGLGLPIVKAIVDAHGGRVWVDSQVGQGTSVFFTIPTAPGVKSDRQPPAAGLNA